MVTDFNQTYCGNHFAKYTTFESLCCTPETNTMLYVNYTSKKKKYPQEIYIQMHHSQCQETKKQNLGKRRESSEEASVKLTVDFSLERWKPKVILGWHTKMAE